MDKDLIIETERLILRRYSLNDVNDIVDGLNNINVTKWLAGAPYPYTKEDAVHFITKSLDNNLYNFAIVLKSENKVIGGTQLTNVDLYNGTAGGGIWISEKYWGKGYAFEIVGLRRLENGYFKENEKSHKMQLKFGYKDEGIRRQRFVSRGSGMIEDEYITGLLKDEWIEF